MDVASLGELTSVNVPIAAKFHCPIVGAIRYSVITWSGMLPERAL
jgi:hypothetical protein